MKLLEEAAEWHYRRQRADLSAEAETIFNAWLKADPRHKDALDQVAITLAKLEPGAAAGGAATRARAPARTPRRQEAVAEAGEIGSTAERILDSAELLWADKSYEAVSIRDIMRAAQLEYSLARYYFGTKEGLFRAVIARRTEDICADYMAALDRAEAAAVGDDSDLDRWLDAVIVPFLDRLTGPDEQWKCYARLIANAVSQDDVRPYLDDFYKGLAPSHERLFRGLGTLLPDLQAVTGVWAIYFLHAAAVSIYRNPRLMDSLLDAEMGIGDYGEIRRIMASFFADGFRGLAARTAKA